MSRVVAKTGTTYVVSRHLYNAMLSLLPALSCSCIPVGEQITAVVSSLQTCTRTHNYTHLHIRTHTPTHTYTHAHTYTRRTNDLGGKFERFDTKPLQKLVA